jgi:hypothetical protein
MAKNIKKIKVAGELYDIYDSEARNNSSIKELVRWDGNTDGLQTVHLMNGVDYYRIADALDNSNGEYIVAESSTLEKASSRMLGASMGEASIMFKIFSVINNINLFNASISFQGKLETLLRRLASLLMPELNQDNLPLANSIRYGLSIVLFGSTQLVTFVNVTKTTTISKEFLNDFYGLSLTEDIIFSPGLWAMKANATEMTGYKDFYVYTDIIYTLPHSTNFLFESGIGSIAPLLASLSGGQITFEDMFNVSATQNSYYSTTIRNYMGENQSTFEENE